MDFRDLEGTKVHRRTRRCTTKQPRLTQRVGEKLLRVTTVRPPKFTVTVEPATTADLATLARHEVEGASLSLM